MALVFLGRHVLTGEEPVAVQVALLEAAEDALDRFRLPVVGLRGDGQLGHAAEEVAVLQFAVSALVVEADLVRLAAGGLERHLVGEELCLHVLPRADVVTQQDFAVGVHHLIHAAGGHSSLRVAVVIVQARTVAVPDGVAHLRQGRLVVAGEELLGLQLAVAEAVPQGAHLGPIQKAPDGVLRADGLPPAFSGHTVIRLEELLHRQAVDRCGVAGDEPFSGLLLEAQGGVVAVVLRYEGGVALLLEAHDEPAEAAFAHRQRVRQTLRLLLGGVGHGVAPKLTHWNVAVRADHLESAEQMAHDGGVVRVSRDGVFGQMRLGLSVGVVAEEGGGLGVYGRPCGARRLALLLPPPERPLDGGYALRPTDRPRVDQRAVVQAPAVDREIATPRVLFELVTGQPRFQPALHAQAQVAVHHLIHGALLLYDLAYRLERQPAEGIYPQVVFTE